MADRGGGRWDVGRDWPDPEPGPDAGAGAATGAANAETAAHPPPPAAYPPPPAAYPPPAYPPPHPTSRSGGYQPSQGYPPGAWSSPTPGGHPLGAVPSSHPATPSGGYHPSPGYPPGVAPPGPYPAPYQPPMPYPPYHDPLEGLPMVDDDLPSGGGLIRPSRVLLLVALVVSAGVVVYGFFVEKGGLQIPISVVGLVMLGVSLLLTALASLRGGLRASREGSVLRSAAVAIFGGLCALGAAGSLATSVFLGFLFQR